MAGWNDGGKGLNLPPGDYVTHITEYKSVMSKGFQGKEPEEQWQWGIQLQMPNGTWVGRSLFTGQRFTDPAKLSDPQFIPKLMRVVRACGLPLPSTAAEAKAWQPDLLLNKQFITRVVEDEETGATEIKYLQVNGTQAAPRPAAQAPARPAAAATPKAAKPPRVNPPGFFPPKPAAAPSGHDMEPDDEDGADAFADDDPGAGTHGVMSSVGAGPTAADPGG
jgi:hypothetical protein